MAKILAILVAVGVAVYAYFYFTAKPPPPAHRYSADDVFYLRQYVSIRTKKGIVGWIPGQELVLTQNGAGPVPGKVLVTDGTYTLAIAGDLLTHDLDEAAALQASDTQWQTSLAATYARDKWNADLHDAAANSYTAAGVNAANALQASQNAVGNYQTGLNQRTIPAGTGSSGGGGGYYGGGVASTTAPMSTAQILALKPNHGQ